MCIYTYYTYIYNMYYTYMCIYTYYTYILCTYICILYTTIISNLLQPEMCSV